MDHVPPLGKDALLKQARAARASGDRQAALKALHSASILDPADVGPRLEMASELRALNRAAEAEAIYQTILTGNDKQLSAIIGLGQIKSIQSDRNASLVLFHQAERLAPDHLGVKLEIGRLLRELGRFDEAEIALRKLLDKNAREVNAYVQLALLKRQQRDLQVSLDLFQTAATLDPERVGIQLEIASSLRQLDSFEEARVVLERVLARDPDNFGANVGLGHLSRKRGDRLASLSHFQRAAKVNPKHIGVLLEIANDQRELGRLTESKRALEAVIDFEPGHGNAHGQLGFLYRLKGEHQKALAAFEQAARCTPSNVLFQIETANCNRQLGRMAAAEATLAKIVGEHAENSHASIALASLLTDGYRLGEAQRVLERALHTRESAAVLLTLGRLFRRLDARSEAMRYFERAHQAEPGNRAAMLEVIEEHRLRGDFAEASQLTDDLIARETSLPAMLQRGRILRDQGKHDLALMEFEEAARRFSNSWQARLEMAIEYRRLAQPSKAGDILTELIAENPNSPSVLDQLIAYLRTADRFEEALDFSRKSITLRPNHHWPYIRAAHISARLGEMDDAWAFLDDAARLAGPHPEITAARIELNRLIRRFDQAEAIFKGLPADAIRSFPVLVQGVQTAILLGDVDLATERLAGAQPQTALAHSAVVHLRGKILEIGWEHAEAIKQYQVALDLSRDNASVHWDLAKCQLLTFQPELARDHLRQFVELNRGTRLLNGSSLNVSQNHIGQLIDEFKLDEELLFRLRRRTDLDTLKVFVRENPDHTPSAIALLIALRKQGQLRLVGSLSLDGPGHIAVANLLIPRTIAQFWHNPEPPAEIARLTATWSEQNPWHAYQRFDRRSASDFLRQNHGHEAVIAFERADGSAQQADIFRLAYLARHGGYYADADDRCSIPLDRFIPAQAAFVAFQEEYGTLGNNFIGAMPGHPTIITALERAIEAVNRGDRDIVWLSTGPGLLTRAFALTLAVGQHELSRSAIFTVGQIQRFLGLHCPALYKSTSQHWLKSSFGEGRIASRRNNHPPQRRSSDDQ